MFQKRVCDSPNAGSGLPAKRDSEIFLASACDLESSQKISPRSFLSLSSSPCSFLPLSSPTPRPLSSKQDSGSAVFITHRAIKAPQKCTPRRGRASASTSLRALGTAPRDPLPSGGTGTVPAQPRRGLCPGHSDPPWDTVGCSRAIQELGFQRDLCTELLRNSYKICVCVCLSVRVRPSVPQLSPPSGSSSGKRGVPPGGSLAPPSPRLSHRIPHPWPRWETRGQKLVQPQPPGLPLCMDMIWHPASLDESGGGSAGGRYQL